MWAGIQTIAYIYRMNVAWMACYIIIFCLAINVTHIA